jgi:hypothetical protein
MTNGAKNSFETIQASYWTQQPLGCRAPILRFEHFQLAGLCPGVAVMQSTQPGVLNQFAASEV